MGYMRHHAIICTSWNEEHIAQAHAKASELFSWVSAISPPAMNGYRSFLIPPDGSKEGWTDSDLGDQHRESMISFLRSPEIYVDWVEIQYADDEGDTYPTRQFVLKRHSQDGDSEDE